jgi:Phosphoribosyl synthetase-associated domain
VDAAHALKERGAYKIYALATHGILSADAPRLIEESPINEVITILFLFGLIVKIRQLSPSIST